MTNTTNIVHSSSNLSSTAPSQQKDSCTISMTCAQLMEHLAAKSNKKKKSTPAKADNDQ